MKKILFFVLVLCLSMAWGNAWGAPIGESQARNIAERFMASKALPAASLKVVHKAPRLGATTATDAAAFYVFNASRGFVIVAGDNRAPSVLGYSDSGSFDIQSLPQAMRELLEGYEAQIDALSRGAEAAPQLRNAAAIAPLVTATWSQDNPYNIMLPYIPSGAHAHVGCVATAMAQVMYYWKWPARPTCPIPAYTSESLSFYMPELPVVDFAWNDMQDTYLTSDTVSAAALAAATLSQYCAQAVLMDFKEQSSGAKTINIANFAPVYFDYDRSTHMAKRCNYSTQGWAELLYTELAAGRPVIYSGSKKTGGHSFICDGYDGNGMFHFNWGWNGNSNGYFVLNVLNPDSQGTGSASGAYGYIMDQGALVGFQPNKGGSHTLELTSTDVTLDSYTGTRRYTSDPFSAVVSGMFANYTTDTLVMRYGWGLFKDGELISNLLSFVSNGLRPGYHYSHTNRQLSFGANITSGTYRIMPMYSEIDQTDWRPCVGADKNYIEVTIDGNQCVATGYGTAGSHSYVINNISMTGYMHNGRPVNMDVNMTNDGLSSNELLYMFVNGQFAAAGYVGLEPGETGDIHYTYLFANAGNYTITWSWDKNGNDPIATRSLTINPMPAANLSATFKILDVTDEGERIITSDKFSLELTITNNGSTPYDEDISAKLYKNIYGTTGSSVQGLNKHLVLGPGETTTMRFDLTNVVDGWKYFATALYYSEGEQIRFARTTFHTIVFPDGPSHEVIPGDVNGDGRVDVTDVSMTISHILGNLPSSELIFQAADVNNDGRVDVTDVASMIRIVLGIKY